MTHREAIELMKIYCTENTDLLNKLFEYVMDSVICYEKYVYMAQGILVEMGVYTLTEVKLHCVRFGRNI